MEFLLSPAWWHWCLLGVGLLVLEILLPGVFFLWLAIGAAATGICAAVFDMTSWQTQGLVFIVFSFISLFLGRRFIKKAAPATHETLNRRLTQYVGRTATLEEAITEGQGRIRLGDTLWRVTGPDSPKGAQVKVTGVNGSDLLVEPVQTAPPRDGDTQS